MASKVCFLLLVSLGIVLVGLTNPVAGEMKAAFAGGTGSWSGEATVLRQLLSTRLEDAVAPELTVDVHLHRRVLAGAIQASGLKANAAACIGSCPPRGGAYTGRGCLKKYHC